MLQTRPPVHVIQATALLQASTLIVSLLVDTTTNTIHNVDVNTHYDHSQGKPVDNSTNRTTRNGSNYDDNANDHSEGKRVDSSTSQTTYTGSTHYAYDISYYINGAPGLSASGSLPPGQVPPMPSTESVYGPALPPQGFGGFPQSQPWLPTQPPWMLSPPSAFFLPPSCPPPNTQSSLRRVDDDRSPSDSQPSSGTQPPRPHGRWSK
ncbi:hypothetical protein BDN72DRAFT_881896 [Pluteus cervinus]|uniref:Uncharacterized protein n=1 Tax=Pluteus cervinus TaxID=181527 RepID=A0ACD3AE41_9AGAR|nr:hypothetical protein BDN72DRAFT_881896 [Pluteus cervinus]